MQIDLNLGNARPGWRQSLPDGDAAASGQGAPQQLQLCPPACPCSPRTADGNRHLPRVGKAQRAPTARRCPGQRGRAPRAPRPGLAARWAAGHSDPETRSWVIGPARAQSCSPVSAGTSQCFCSPLRVGEQNKPESQGVEGCFLSLFQELLFGLRASGWIPALKGKQRVSKAPASSPDEDESSRPLRAYLVLSAQGFTGF